jgi:hypothetical protein
MVVGQRVESQQVDGRVGLAGSACNVTTSSLLEKEVVETWHSFDLIGQKLPNFDWVEPSTNSNACAQ